MSELLRAIPTTVMRIYCRVKYGVVRSVQEENRFYEKLASSVGLRYTPPDTSKQEDALMLRRLQGFGAGGYVRGLHP